MRCDSVAVFGASDLPVPLCFAVVRRFGAFVTWQEHPMNRDLRRRLTLVAICLFCAIMVCTYSGDLGASEFSGGRVTGPLLSVYDTGSLMFIFAIPLTFFFRRIAAALIVLASLLCLPLYFYFTTPGPFRRLFPWKYVVPLKFNFVWNRWAIFGILALAVAACVGIRGLLISAEGKPQHSA